MREEVAKHCEKLVQDINEVESLVKKNEELIKRNTELHEKNHELTRQLCEMQENMAKKDKVCFYVENRFTRLISIANS